MTQADWLSLSCPMASKMAAFGPVWPIQSLQFAGALWTHARDTGSPGTLTSSGVQARKTITVSTFESGNHSSCFFCLASSGLLTFEYSKLLPFVYTWVVVTRWCTCS